MKKTAYFLLLSCVFASLSCTSNFDAYPVYHSQGTICVTAYHHSIIVPQLDAYLKYNTETSAGWDYKKYDKHLQADTLGHVCFDSLPIGSHCIMMLGYDPYYGGMVYGYKVISIDKLVQTKELKLFVTE